MKKIFTSLIVLLALLSPAYAQSPSSILPKEAAVESAPFKVDGLELPPDQTVANDEGFVTLQAKTKGKVKWLVVAAVKVKFVEVPDNSIIVSVPPQGVVITIFAVAIVDGKLTEFARTNITAGPPQQGTGPVTTPAAAPNANPLHVTFLLDTNNTTAEVAAIVNSKQLQGAITAKGNYFRYYDIKSPVVAQKKLDTIAQKAGSSFVLIVQRSDGVVILAAPIPRTEQEVTVILQKVGGV